MMSVMYGWLLTGLVVLAMRWDTLVHQALPEAKEKLLEDHDDPLGGRVLPLALKVGTFIVPVLIVVGWPLSVYRRLRDWYDTFRSCSQTDTDS